MRVQHHSHSYPTQSKEFWEGGCDCWQVPPTVPWARGAERTVEGFPRVTADLEASVKTNVLSSAVEAGCFSRPLCTPPLLPFLHFTPPTFAARINIFWATEAISSWSGGEDWNSRQENTHSVSAAKSGPYFLLLCLCGLGKVVTIVRRFLYQAGIWNGIVTMDIREPCPFLLVLPMFERC